MNYRNDKHGEPISLLGYGCMRFTKKGKNIDLDKAEKELRTAIDAGVNYLDTAYIYPGSEVAVGEILARTGLRNKVNLATKLPGYMIKSEKSIEKHFQEQLSRLQTDHIDYYLMHMLTDLQSWNKLCDLGIKDWIREKKESGAIRNIGFSFHGNSDRFLQILNAYESDGPSAGVGGMGASLGNGSGEVLGSGVKKSMWDFCQIQYNYLDETTQAGVIGLRAAAEKGIPVIIMEPLRGGKLVDMLPEKARELIRNDPKKRTPAELALRYAAAPSQVCMVLSGMSALEQVRENVSFMAEPLPLNEAEQEAVEKIRTH
ncbi:MAG: aldo/keto reductase, partial [Eubacterium sp.]|nr:aldo/keto reductase [Eubacterium sp.]